MSTSRTKIKKAKPTAFWIPVVVQEDVKRYASSIGASITQTATVLTAYSVINGGLPGVNTFFEVAKDIKINETLRSEGNSKSVQIAFTLPTSIRETLHSYASELEVSLSQAVTVLLAVNLNNELSVEQFYETEKTIEIANRKEM